MLKLGTFLTIRPCTMYTYTWSNVEWDPSYATLLDYLICPPIKEFKVISIHFEKKERTLKKSESRKSTESTRGQIKYP